MELNQWDKRSTESLSKGKNMRISAVRIVNFRALRELELKLASLSVIIGENDCGKTSVMLALQTFFNGAKLTDKGDYFKTNVQQPVQIEVQFVETGDRFGEVTTGGSCPGCR